jgi:hypothetical protein
LEPLALEIPELAQDWVMLALVDFPGSVAAPTNKQQSEALPASQQQHCQL